MQEIQARGENNRAFIQTISFEDRPERMSTNKTQLQPLAIQAKNEQDEKITELSSKISTFEDHLEKMSINKTQIQPLALQLKNEQDEKITDI